MTSTIRATRLAQNLSLNEVAARLGVTPSAISQLERSEIDETIKLASLREALRAMNSDVRITAGSLRSNSSYAPFRVADAMSKAITLDRDPIYALRLLTQAVAEISGEQQLARDEIDIAPTPLPSREWDTLMRAMFARTLPARSRPAWMKTEPLPEPWFVSQYAVLRERARNNTSADLSALNIFIDERSLSRA